MQSFKSIEHLFLNNLSNTFITNESYPVLTQIMKSCALKNLLKIIRLLTDYRPTPTYKLEKPLCDFSYL